jgi:hypothetical protein
LAFPQPHTNALPAFGRDEFHASVFKGAADGGYTAEAIARRREISALIRVARVSAIRRADQFSLS